MRIARLLLLSGLLSLTAIQLCNAEDAKPMSKVWVNNKLTPEQPFPARVVAISSSWMGYTLLLEEITEDDLPSMCIARIGHVPLTYEVYLSRYNPENQMKHKQMHTEFLEKPIPVSKFSYEKGVYKIGLKYGKKDGMLEWYTRQKQSQREEYENRKPTAK